MTTISIREMERRQKQAPMFIKNHILPALLEAAPRSPYRKKIFEFLDARQRAKRQVSWEDAKNITQVLHLHDMVKIKKTMEDYWYR